MINKYGHQILINNILSILTLILLIYFAVAFSSLYGGPGLIYNSDIISIPYFYVDLTQHGGSIFHWNYPPTMCFFPDVIVYFILAALSRHPKIAIILFVIFQYALFYFLSVAIGRATAKVKKDAYLVSISIFLVLLLFASGYLGQNIFYAFSFAGHFGAALMFLLGLLLIIKNFQHEKKWNYRFLFGIVFLTVFSDIIYLTQFIIPAILSLFLLSFFSEKDNLKIFKKHIKTISIAALISLVFYATSKFTLDLHISSFHTLKRYHPAALWNATKMIFYKLSVFYQSKNAIIVLLLFLYFIISIAFFAKLIIKKRKGIFISKKDQPFVFVLMMFFISIIIGYFSLIVSDNDLMSKDLSLRHFQTIVLFPVFIGLPIYLMRYTNLGNIISKYYATFILSILFCILIFHHKGESLMKIVNYYPPSVACIDRYAKEYHLKNGIAGYWDSKSISFLSKQHVNIVAVRKHKKSLIPQIWFDTIDDYSRGNFNFVIVNNTPHEYPNAKDITKVYGSPLYTLQCPDWHSDPGTIFVYKKGIINSLWNKEKLMGELQHHILSK